MRFLIEFPECHSVYQTENAFDMIHYIARINKFQSEEKEDLFSLVGEGIFSILQKKGRRNKLTREEVEILFKQYIKCYNECCLPKDKILYIYLLDGKAIFAYDGDLDEHIVPSRLDEYKYEED